MKQLALTCTAVRSGTNQFCGSLFWTNRNSAIDANNWFNNFYGVEQNYMNRNQYGGRVGGPIIRNKTFFFFLFEGQRIARRNAGTIGRRFDNQRRLWPEHPQHAIG